MENISIETILFILFVMTFAGVAVIISLRNQMGLHNFDSKRNVLADLGTAWNFTDSECLNFVLGQDNKLKKQLIELDSPTTRALTTPDWIAQAFLEIGLDLAPQFKTALLWLEYLLVYDRIVVDAIFEPVIRERTANQVGSIENYISFTPVPEEARKKVVDILRQLKPVMDKIYDATPDVYWDSSEKHGHDFLDTKLKQYAFADSNDTTRELYITFISLNFLGFQYSSRQRNMQI